MQPNLITDYARPLYKVTNTKLFFDILDDYTFVTGVFDVQQNSDYYKHINIPKHDLEFDGTDDKNVMELISVSTSSENQPLTSNMYNLIGDKLIIKISDIPDDKFQVHIGCKLYPHKNTQLSGLYKSNNVYCTQCEPHGFRRIIYSLDRPDVMSTYTVRISASKTSCPVLLSNGNLIESGDCADPNIHYVVYEDPFPKPSYLFALVAGDLGYKETCYYLNNNINEENKVIIRIYVPHNKLNYIDLALESVKLAMKWDEDTYGLSYDLKLFNIVGLDDFNMGAMENKGLNVFNSKYILSDPKKATDLDQEALMGVVAHEYFHNWTGNRVTLEKWFDLTLKEGLTVFRDESFSMDIGASRIRKLISNVDTLRKNQFPEDDCPNAHPIRPRSYIVMDNFYSTTVYQKGAQIIRIYETLLGKLGFRKGMDLYFKRHDGQAVRCEDFWQAMNDANIGDNKNLDLSMKRLFNWYHQCGTPILEINYTYSNNCFKMICKQTNPKCLASNNGVYVPVLIPIKMCLFDEDTGKQIMDESVLDFCELESSYEFKLDNIKNVVPSFMRSFSAPVITKIYQDNMPFTIDDMIFLLQNDTDEFNRYEASRNIMSDIMVKLYMSDDFVKTDLYENFISLMIGILNTEMDLILKCSIITLPSQEEIIPLIANCDPIKLFEKVHLKIYYDIATRYKDGFDNLVTTLISDLASYPNYELNKEQISKRALLGRYVSYLAILSRVDETDYFNNITNIYNAFDVMTTKSNMISALGFIGFNASECVLDDLINDHKNDSLMISKWLKFYSQIAVPDIALNLKHIYDNSVYFNKLTPNHVYALIYAFRINPYFHQIKDGKAIGYELFEYVINDLDKLNPSVSSYIASAFEIKNKLSNQNKQLINEVISRIIKNPELSMSVREVLEKI